MSTIRDKTRIRKTYSYQRTKPVLDETSVTSSSSDTTGNVSGYFEGGWSPVSRARDNSYNITLASGNYNTGREFHFDDFAASSGNSITGVRFWWPGDSGTKTIRCRLYSGAGTTVLASVDVEVDDTAGVRIGIFSSPVLLTAALAYTIMTVTIWETSGAYYVGANSIVTDRYLETSSITIAASPGLYWGEWAEAFGNNNPTSAGTECYPVEPIFDIV